MNLTEFRKLVSPKILAANWTEAVSNQIPYLGETLFPSKQKAGLDLKWIKGSKGLPVSLMPSAFDTKATFRGREGIKLTETEMPFSTAFSAMASVASKALRVSDGVMPVKCRLVTPSSMASNSCR